MQKENNFINPNYVLFRHENSRKEAIPLVKEGKNLRRITPFEKTDRWDVFLREHIKHAVAVVIVSIYNGKHNCRVSDIKWDKVSQYELLQWLRENEHVCDSFLKSLRVSEE